MGPNCLAINNYQVAVQLAFEVLGSKTNMTPVILPVTAGPDILAAVLRAGGLPSVLDIDETTLQMCPVELEKALKELEAAVVVFCRPGGGEVALDLLKLTEELPTVVASRLPPSSHCSDAGTFNIFDLKVAAGSGGVLHCRYKQQVKDLEYLRSGSLGHNAQLPPRQCELARDCLHNRSWTDYTKTQDTVVENYITALKKQDCNVIIPFEDNELWTCFYVQVPCADIAVTHLNSYGIRAKLGVFPLHHLPEVKSRWQKDPGDKYPVADKLRETIVALPVHPGVRNKEDWIIKKLLEVTK